MQPEEPEELSAESVTVGNDESSKGRGAQSKITIRKRKMATIEREPTHDEKIANMVARIMKLASREARYVTMSAEDKSVVWKTCGSLVEHRIAAAAGQMAAAKILSTIGN